MVPCNPSWPTTWYITTDGFELLILLLPPPKCQGKRSESWFLFYEVLEIGWNASWRSSKHSTTCTISQPLILFVCFGMWVVGFLFCFSQGGGLFLFCFLDSVLVCIPGWPQTLSSLLARPPSAQITRIDKLHTVMILFSKTDGGVSITSFGNSLQGFKWRTANFQLNITL